MFLKHIMVGAIQTNCYLVGADTSRDCVVIDPGADAVRILQELKKYGKVLGGVLLTHGHFDHMGALQELVKDAEVPVYISIDRKSVV